MSAVPLIVDNPSVADEQQIRTLIQQELAQSTFANLIRQLQGKTAGQKGQATLGSSGTQAASFTVNFPVAFTSPPKVTCSAHGGAFADTFTVTVTGSSTTAFTVNVFRVDSAAGWAQSLKLDWQAWVAD